MSTLKQHQAAMVNLLANGTAIPTSAVRLAHALHDVLSHLNGAENAPEAHTERRIDATTSGLNDAALAEAIGMGMKRYSGAFQTMADNSQKRTSAEQQIARLNNTIRQLRESNLKLRKENGELEKHIDMIRSGWVEPEQAGGHMSGKEQDDVAEKALKIGTDYAELVMKYSELVKILAFYGVDDLDKARAEYAKYNTPAEQAGCRKEDTEGADGCHTGRWGAKHFQIQNLPRAEGDGWIEWGGGVRPVLITEFIEYRMRDGSTDFCFADDIWWQHKSQPCDSDIVAYRVLGEPK